MQSTTTAAAKRVETKVLSSFHHTVLVVMVPSFARQESQVYREILDPRDHPVRKDPQDHVETKAMQGNQEAKDSLAPRAIQEARDLQARWQITGNNAFGKI